MIKRKMEIEKVNNSNGLVLNEYPAFFWLREILFL